MSIQECYEKLGGDYVQVEKRLMNANMVKRFVTKFLDDSTFSELCRAMEVKDWKEAFRFAHMLKGVSASLGFDRLLASASELTEVLRNGTDNISDSAASLLENVKQDYDLTISVIRDYLSANA